MARVAPDPSGRRRIALTPNRWTEDGLRGHDVHLFQLGEPRSTQRVLETEGYTVGEPTVSPDGPRRAHVGRETGRDEVVVCSFPDLSGRRMQISVVGGSAPTRGPDGSTLFYVNGNRRLIQARIGAAEGGSGGRGQLDRDGRGGRRLKVLLALGARGSSAYRSLAQWILLHLSSPAPVDEALGKLSQAPLSLAHRTP